MNPMQEMASGLLDIIEELLLEVEAREAVLKHLELEGDDYSDLVARAKALSADKVRRVVSGYRDEIFRDAASDSLPPAAQKTVRQLLESLDSDDYWED